MFPAWLQALLTEKFFNACLVHEEARKNEKNIFCLDCCSSFCPHCFPLHSSHRLLQIRRYVYQDVLRLDDAAKLIDCSSVQAYTSNSAKVVFLKQRPQTRQIRGPSGNICCTCHRPLQDPYLFCSLSCKIDHIVRTQGGGGLSDYLRECSFLPLPDGDPGLMTPDTVLEPACTSSSSGGHGGVGCWTVSCTAATDFVVRKKRTSVLASCNRSCLPARELGRPACGPASEISAGMMSRRKKTPHRAPLL